VHSTACAAFGLGPLLGAAGDPAGLAPYASDNGRRSALVDVALITIAVFLHTPGTGLG